MHRCVDRRGVGDLHDTRKHNRDDVLEGVVGENGAVAHESAAVLVQSDAQVPPHSVNTIEPLSAPGRYRRDEDTFSQAAELVSADGFFTESGASSPSDATSALEVAAEEIEDELCSQQASREHLAVWKRKDEALIQAMRSEIEGCPPLLRTAAMQFIHRLATLVRLDLRGLCDCALFFDSATRGEQVTLETLPALCIAVVRMIHKMETAVHSDLLEEHLEPIAANFVQHLTSIFPDAEEVVVTEEQISHMERTLLMRIGDRLTIQSCFSWIGAYAARCGAYRTYLARLDGTARSMCPLVLDWVKQRSLASAQGLLMWHPTEPEMSPRRISIGLFCLGLVFAGMVPVECFCPADLTLSEWKERITESWKTTCMITQSPASHIVPVCSFARHQWEAILQVATCSGVSCLRRELVPFVDFVFFVVSQSPPMVAPFLEA